MRGHLDEVGDALDAGDLHGLGEAVRSGRAPQFTDSNVLVPLPPSPSHRQGA